MSPLVIGLLVALLVVAAIAMTLVVIWFRGRGDPELRAIDREAKESQKSAYAAAMKASKQMSAASAVRREVRHTRRQLAAQERTERGQDELLALTGTTSATGSIPPPPPPPAHP